MVDDHELLGAWRVGDRTAGKLLFERHYDGLARFFRSKLGGGAEDLVQKVFTACVEGRDHLRSDTSFRAYLYAIAHNTLRSHFRERARLPLPIDFGDERSLYDLSPGISTLQGLAAGDRLLLEAIRRIPLNSQIVLELRYWEEMSGAEIAQVLGVPPPTARSRLQRARELLEQEMTALETSSTRLRSTLDNLEQWAGRLRLHFTQAG